MRYLEGPRPRILAHRGLAVEVPENTLPAFARALEVGATHLESDIRVTADGVAVLAHDATLARVAGLDAPIASLTLDELHHVEFGNTTVPTLAEALAAFPDARWNLDLKVSDAVQPAARDIEEAGVVDNVLLTSFDEATRARAVRMLPSVASSASRRIMSRALLAARVGARARLRRVLDDVVAVQVPQRAGRLTIVDARTVEAFHEAGVEVHVWTVNDAETMRALVAIGVDGIVTDRADVAVATLRT